MRRCTASVLLCLSLFVAAPALAQPLSSTDAEAHSVFEAGRTAYSSGRFQDALGYFQRAYELSHRPELLYNIGQAQDRLRLDADAIATFEQFEAALPDAPQREEVTARLAILREAAAHQTPAPVPEVIPPPAPEPVAEPAPAEPPPPPPAASPAPWIVLGVGGAAAIVGAILLGVGYADIGTVDNARNVPFASVSGAYSDAPVLTGVGWGMLGAGVALAAVGLGWGLSSGGGGSTDQARLRIGPTGVSLSGSF